MGRQRDDRRAQGTGVRPHAGPLVGADAGKREGVQRAGHPPQRVRECVRACVLAVCCLFVCARLRVLSVWEVRVVVCA